LVKLMARLYDPTGGSILLDGVDLRDYSIEDLQKQNRRHPFQDFVRYDLSARLNIGRRKYRRAPSGRRAEQGSPAEPRGWHFWTVCREASTRFWDARFEGGVDLSGGEWAENRTGARAYLRDAQILILDEAHRRARRGSGNPKSFARFAELARGRTAMVILAPVFRQSASPTGLSFSKKARFANRERTTSWWPPAEQYARLFELQAANYR